MGDRAFPSDRSFAVPRCGTGARDSRAERHARPRRRCALATAVPAALLAVSSLAAVADPPPLTDPRQDLHFANPQLRALMGWVSFRLSFDSQSLVPDMAAGEARVTPHGTPRFAPGIRGSALVAGGDSGQGLYTRGPNAPLELRGALSLWVCPLAWTHQNGGNTTLVMTSNSSFYIQRQGPMHNAEGVVTRQEGLQYLMLSKTTGNQCLMVGTNDWPTGKWRFVVANWDWPTMSLSLDGGEFRSVSAKQPPAPADFGALIVGARGGETALLDEVTIYRRPLTLDETRELYRATGVAP